jgi:outer membrane protein TolC
MRHQLHALWVLAAVVFAGSDLAAQQAHVQRITLDEAKTRAGTAQSSNLGQLSIEAAKYHRQAVQADYFPKVDSTFLNLHFNKFMGQTIELATRTVGLPLLEKDQTIAVFTATQPLTPIFKVKQAVRIARADETVALAKAAQLTAHAQNEAERLYFALLIAQRKETLASIRTQTAARSVAIEPAKELITARSEVGELMHSLNDLLKFDPETELELAIPEAAFETISEGQATQQALANNPEVVEAEQTVVKARAVVNLSKLEYVPDVAVMGGYTYQTAIPLLPRDFSFIGVVATMNVFDFGKREKTVSEHRTQLEMARVGVDLTKTKVAAAARKAFFDLERSRRIRDLTRQIAMNPLTRVSYEDSPLTAGAERAQAELDMFQAELEYRQAYADLQRVIEGR